MSTKNYYSWYLFLLILFCISKGDTSSADNFKYIHADIANVRTSPSPNSAIIFRLRINTLVEELKTKDGWTFVKYGNLVKGWISSSLVGDYLLTEKDIRDSITLHQYLNKKWAERLIAAYPDNSKNWDLFEQICDSLNDTAGLNYIIAYRKGKNDAFIAIGNHGIIQLLGKIDTSGLFYSLSWIVYKYADSDDSVEIKRGIAIQAIGRKWYTVSGQAADSSFDRFNTGPSKKWINNLYEIDSTYYPAYLEGYDFNVKWFEIGKCFDSQIYATKPIIKGKRELILNKPIDSLCKLMNVDFVKPYYSIGLFEGVTFPQKNIESDNEHYYPWHSTGIYNGKGERIYPQGSAVTGSYKMYDGNKYCINEIFFFSFLEDPDEIIYGVYQYFEPSGLEGAILHLDLISFDKNGKIKGFNIFENYQGS